MREIIPIKAVLFKGYIYENDIIWNPFEKLIFYSFSRLKALQIYHKLQQCSIKLSSTAVRIWQKI